MLASFFPAFLAGLPFVSKILELEKNNAQIRLSYLAQSTSHQVEKTLNQIFTQSDKIHKNPIAFLQSNPIISAIYIVDSQGSVQSTTPHQLQSQQHLPFLPTIKEYLGQPIPQDSQTIISWDQQYSKEHGTKLKNTNTSENSFIFRIKYFANDLGKISNAVVLAIPSERLFSIIQTSIGPKSRASLTSINSPILTVPYEDAQLKENFNKKESSNSSRDEIISSTPVHLDGIDSLSALTLTIWEHSSHYKNPILESAVWMGGLLIIIVIFFGYIGYLVAQWLLKPMEILSLKVKDFSTGQYKNPRAKVDFVEFNDFLNLLENMALKIEEQIEEVSERRKREAILEKERIQAELTALRFQMNPHFLFNALNNISAMISFDQKSAQEMLEKLSSLYHKILEASQHITIPLSSELSLIRDYIYLQKIRFGERLHYQEHVPQHLMNMEIPGMLLQSLVENAIKHGIEKARGGGIVEINIEQQYKELCIQVINTGRTYTPQKNSKGIGLVNTKKRLSSIYGSLFSFDISSDRNERTVVTIRLSHRGEHDSNTTT